MPFRELSRNISLDGQPGFRELPKGTLLDGETQTSFGEETLKGSKRTISGIVGLGEAAGAMLTGLVGSAAGGIVGLRKIFARESPEAASAEIGRVSKALTYEPQTFYGKELTAGAEYGLEKLSQAGRFVGEKVQDVLSKSKWTKPLAPYLATAADTAVQTAAFGLAGKLVKPGRVAGPETFRPTPEEIRMERGLRPEELPPGPEVRLLPPGEAPKQITAGGEGNLPTRQTPKVFLNSQEGVIEVKYNPKTKRYEAEKAPEIEQISVEKPIEKPPAEVPPKPSLEPEALTPKPPLEVPKAKEPWEMSKEEYLKSISMSEYVKDMEPAIKLQELKEPTRENVLSREHKQEVKQALSEGKPVPPEVLKDYPDLAPKPPIAKPGKWKVPTGLQPLVEEIESVGGKINPNGTIDLYHATTKEKAQELLKSGVLKRPSDAPDSYGVYASTSKAVAEDYGDGTLIKITVPVKDIHPDDVFPGKRLDFSIPTKQGNYKPIKISLETGTRKLPEPGKVGELNPAEIKALGIPEDQVRILNQIRKENPEEYAKILKGNTKALIAEWEANRLGKAKGMAGQGLFGESKEPLFAKKETQNLVQWVRDQGGIWDESLKGETKQFLGQESGIRGLVSKTGKPFDELAKSAIADGWLPEGATARDLIDLLSKDVAGAKGGGPRVVPNTGGTLRNLEKYFEDRGLLGDEAGFLEIPVEDLRRAGRRFWEFWKPMTTLQNREQILADRGKALGGMARVERIVGRVYDRLKGLPDKEKHDIFKAMDGQIEIESLSPDSRVIAKSLLNTNNIIGEMLVKRGIIEVGQYNAHKGEYIRYMYLRHILGDNVKLVSKPNGKLDLSYAIKRKDLTPEQRRALGIIEDVSLAQPLGMAKALGDVVKYDYLEKLASDPRNVWTPSIVEVPDVPKEFIESHAKGEADFLSRSTGDKFNPVYLGKDRWIVWNKDSGKPVARKMGIGDLAEELDIYRRMNREAPGTPEIQYKLASYEAAMKKAMEATKNVPEDFIQLPSSKHWGPMSGAFVRKEVARDLMTFWSKDQGDIPGLAGAVEKLARTDEKMTGFFKLAKVPLNLPTAIRNTVSNVVQLAMSGMRPDQIAIYGVKAVSEIIAKGPEYTQAFRNGLFKTNWSVAELNEVMNVFRKMEGGTWGSMIGAMHNLAKYYGRIDDVFKMTKYLEQREAGATVEKAVMEGQKWGMDYSLADPAVKWARRHFIPFASYTYKIIPLLVESAIKRPWVIGSLMALPSAMWEVSKQINSDMTESDWKDLQKTIPTEVKERGTWMIVPVKINGKWRWFDYSYFLPWGNVQGAIQAGKKGDIQGVTGQLGVAGTPLMTLIKTFAIDPLRENPPNDPFSGTPLYNRLDEPILKAGKTMEFIYNSFAPSMFTRFGALGYTASIGKEDRWGRTIDVPQAMARWFGVNLIEPNSKASGVAVKAKVNALRDEFIKISVDPNISSERKEKYRQRFLEQINELVAERNK